MSLEKHRIYIKHLVYYKFSEFYLFVIKVLNGDLNFLPRELKSYLNSVSYLFILVPLLKMKESAA
ncbi:hypothetical protein LEP1GSC050_3221 [Leptospira broomii serovar Hurstbridge str. 5399]|uniref:Uncharacterized protein n=1 Tax=Leptospira broomii serovar Hurstbridge str. 5399 TaxID=1049789 RepID=T0F893_9LEPT|nr:hypothetical protein LEP1GSC050_3221 [Leptospira broomii serovar Hurstbridge str. 5399]